MENGGFSYIIDECLKKQVSTDTARSLNDRFELKSVSFMLVLMRVIMSAAFATDKTAQIGEAIGLARK